MAYKFTLPELGEGIHEGEIVSILVSEGQEINEDDIILDCLLYTSPSPRD